MNRPKRPVLMTIGRPQFGQISSVGSCFDLELRQLLLRRFELEREGRIERRAARRPNPLPLGDLVEVAFHAGRELEVDDFLEVLGQQVVDRDADVGRVEAAIICET